MHTSHIHSYLSSRIFLDNTHLLRRPRLKRRMSLSSPSYDKLVNWITFLIKKVRNKRSRGCWDEERKVLFFQDSIFVFSFLLDGFLMLMLLATHCPQDILKGFLNVMWNDDGKFSLFVRLFNDMLWSFRSYRAIFSSKTWPSSVLKNIFHSTLPGVRWQQEKWKSLFNWSRIILHFFYRKRRQNFPS